MGTGALRHRRRGRATRHGGVPRIRTYSGRGELLAGVYLAGDLGVLAVWLLDPSDIAHPALLGALMVVVLCAGIGLVVARRRLPPYAGDLAIGGSIVLITLAVLCCPLRTHVGLFEPYYVWVGFASPMWMARRRALAAVALAVVASGAVTLVSDHASALAFWFIIVVTLVVAFVTVDALTRTLVERERLAAVGEMASMITHELRNPLGVVANALYLARHTLGPDSGRDVAQHLDMAEREVDKANAIISHLVAFVRPRAPMLEPVAVADLVAEVLETTPAPPDVTVAVAVGATALVTDRGQLAEILVNLVSNAYDAVEGRGAVRIAAARGDHGVTITVEDDGCGFDGELLERIFEPFFTTKHSGTGLGLAIVRRLATLNGGDIGVTSARGQGTRFTVTLPAGRAPTAPVPPPGRGRPASSAPVTPRA
ncbi:MAG TPA: ATP-binding protein [Acidimicrobiales bacterium]|nr:ATP-binding protein [Acidimicrobiales bacterium]